MQIEVTSKKPWPKWSRIPDIPNDMPKEQKTVLWLPYAAAGALLICLVVVMGLCLFSTKFRQYCFNCCCCCRCNKATSDQKYSGPPNTRSLSRSNSDSIEHIPPRNPTGQQYAAPSKQHMTNTVNTQKYIGNLLSQGRRAPPPPMFSAGPASAPPAAKAVARTVKIIGDMLSYDGPNRKHRK